MLKLDEILVTRNWVGKPVQRQEDLRFVKGEGSYVDDLDMDCHQAAILRSPHAHARIKKIDVSKALALKGVIAVLTGQEAAGQTKPISARAITRPATLRPTHRLAAHEVTLKRATGRDERRVRGIAGTSRRGPRTSGRPRAPPSP